MRLGFEYGWLPRPFLHQLLAAQPRVLRRRIVSAGIAAGIFLHSLVTAALLSGGSLLSA